MAKQKGLLKVSKCSTSARFVEKEYASHTPDTTKKDIEGFIKEFYKKNGKAMSQLAYE